MRSPVCSKLVSILIILSLVVMVAPASFAAVTATIHGTVKNQETGAPIRSALVELFQPGVTSAVSRAVTDASGSYTLSGIIPGAYTINVTSQSFQGATAPLTVVQEEAVTEDFNLILATNISKKTTRIIVSAVQRSQTSSTYTVTERDEQEREPNPTASYQFPGLVVGTPGVTFDPSGGYVHMRGSDENSISFQQDGIPLIDALDGQFTTNIVTVGLKDANVEEGGQQSDIGGSLGGAINEVTKTGRDLVSAGKPYGGSIETELGPGHGWNYTGSDDEFGGTLGDKADYYLNAVVFRNRFPSNYNGLTNLPDSYDGIYKLDLYPDKNNTMSFYYGKGNEEYQEADPSTLAETQLNWKTNTLVNRGSGFADEEMQGYQNTYFSFQHKFNQQSNLQYKFDYNPENVDVYLNADVPGGLGAGEGVFEHLDYHKYTHQLDYQNQFSQKFTLAAGYQYIPEHDRELEAIYSPSTSFQNDVYVQLYGGSGNGYYTPSSDVTLNRNAFYLNGQIKPVGEKLTLNLGTRFDSMEYQTHTEGNFTKKAVDPRFGIVYSPTRTTAIHAAADTTSQFADGRRVEFVSSDAAGFGSYDTLPGDEAAVLASRYHSSEPDAQEQNNYELGITQGFTIPKGGGLSSLVSGNYNFQLTGFQDKQYNLLDYSRPLILPGLTGVGWRLAGPRSYQSNGTGHSAGIEMQLSKPARSRADQSYNGFLTYTNETVRRTSSFFDSAYIPYYANAFYQVAGITQQQFAAGLSQEYAPSWDQRHTVYAELNKRAGKVVNFHLNLDAGSGYPFVIGVSSLAAVGAGLAPTIDSQHTGNGAFGTVPVILPNGSLQPLNATPGRTGWHYKFGLNTDFDITPKMSLFLETDNIFDRKTVTIYSTVDAYGNLYYHAPTYAHPQGTVYYGPNTILLPEYIAFGARLRF